MTTMPDPSIEAVRMLRGLTGDTGARVGLIVDDDGSVSIASGSPTLVIDMVRMIAASCEGAPPERDAEVTEALAVVRTTPRPGCTWVVYVTISDDGTHMRIGQTKAVAVNAAGGNA